MKMMYIKGLSFGVLLLFSSCYTRKLQPRLGYQPNSSPLESKPFFPSLRNFNHTVPDSPKMGHTEYLNFVQEYINTYSPLAIQEMNEFGVPASIILAQGIHESGAGKSSLAVEAKNHFGIKCTSDWMGPGYFMKDDKPNECFRKYSNPEQSFQDHMAFLQRKRYTSLFNLSSTDYKAWAFGLKVSGYATNPNYPQILIGLVQKYNLNRFDVPVNRTKNSSNSKGMVLVGNSNVLPKVNPIVYDTIHKQVVVVDTLYSYTYKQTHSDTLLNRKSNFHPSFQIPSKADLLDSDFYKVRQGDTLYNISKRFNLNPDQIRQINNLPDWGIKIDQIIRIKP